MSYFRENIDAMRGYVPGEQPGAGADVIKINTNENPYPPSPAAMEVLRASDAEPLRRYPDPMARAACRAAAEAWSVPPEWVLAGNGSDDLLTMIFRACAGPRRKAAYATPTYTLYRTLAQIQGAEHVEVPSGPNFELPAAALIEAGAAVTFVASPNSPTGTAVATSTLREMARALAGVLVIDEAYVDFAEDSALALTAEFGNTVVLRTLSKGYSLAGLRLGFGIAQPSLLAGLVKVKDSYNVNAATGAVGAAALADQAYHRRCVGAVKASRARLAGGLEGLGFTVWPSQSNFLLVRPPAGDAERIYRELKARRILVRYFAEPRLDDKLRITVGTDAQVDALLAALKELV